MRKDNDNIVWLQGGYYARRIAFNKIISYFPNREIVICREDTEPVDIIRAIKTIDCFSQGRVVHIVDIPKFTKSNYKSKFNNEIKKGLEVLNENIMVIFNGVDSIKNRAILSYVKKNGRYLEYPLKLSKQEARAFIKQKTQKEEFLISEDSIDYMINHCSYDSTIEGISSDLLEVNIRKLFMYCEDKNIKKDDVIATSIHSESMIVWDFINALDERKCEQCFNIINNMVIQSNDVKGSLLPLISILLWKYRLSFFIKELMSQGDDNEVITKKTEEMRKLVSNGNGIGSSFSPEIIKSGDNAGKEAQMWNANAVKIAINGNYNHKASVELWSRRDMYRIIDLIQSTIQIIRLNNSDNVIMLLLDTVIMTICNKIDDYSSYLIRKSLTLENYYV